MNTSSTNFFAVVGPLTKPAQNSKEEDRLFVEEMLINTKRFITLFSEAVDRLMPERLTSVTEEEAQSAENILTQHRKANVEADLAKPDGRSKAKLPPEITRA